MPRYPKDPVEALIGGEIRAYAEGQSLESRYGKSGSTGGAGASAVLGLQAKRQRRDDAVALPRFVGIAITDAGATLIGYRKEGKGAVPYSLGAVQAGQFDLEVKSGLFWTRVTIADPVNARSYMVFMGRIMSGRGAVIGALRGMAG